MARQARILYLMTFFWTALAMGATQAAQSGGSELRLTVEEVVRLTHAGFGEDIVITKIKKNAKPFDLSTEELVDLKKEGVSDKVIKYLLDPSLPYTPPTPPAAAQPGNPTTKTAEPAKKYPEDSYAIRVPAEPGVYAFSANGMRTSELKLLLGTEQPKSLLRKGKAVAYLIGPKAKMRLSNASPVVYARLPEGKEIEELLLVELSGKNGRRELELGASSAKQSLKAEDIRPKDCVEVGSHLFKITPAKLSVGEYLFFFIGSAEPAKGVFGKGYDFGIEK